MNDVSLMFDGLNKLKLNIAETAQKTHICPAPNEDSPVEGCRIGVGGLDLRLLALTFQSGLFWYSGQSFRSAGL
jgi:hypothetical protein